MATWIKISLWQGNSAEEKSPLSEYSSRFANMVFVIAQWLKKSYDLASVRQSYVGLACMSTSPRKNSRKDICHPGGDGGADVQVGQLWQNVEPDTGSAFRLFVQGAPVSAVELHLGHYWWRADSGEHSLQMSVGWRSMLETTFLPLLFQHGVFFIFFPPPSLLLHIFPLKEYFSSAAVGSLFITCLNTVKL